MHAPAHDMSLNQPTTVGLMLYRPRGINLYYGPPIPEAPFKSSLWRRCTLIRGGDGIAIARDPRHTPDDRGTSGQQDVFGGRLGCGRTGATAQLGSVLDRDFALVARSVGGDLGGCDFIGYRGKPDNLPLKSRLSDFRACQRSCIGSRAIWKPVVGRP
jgi:hypothetical protein